MTATEWCPVCGGPASRLEPDPLTGDALLACDAYRPCGWIEGEPGPDSGEQIGCRVRLWEVA